MVKGPKLGIIIGPSLALVVIIIGILTGLFQRSWLTVICVALSIGVGAAIVIVLAMKLIDQRQRSITD